MARFVFGEALSYRSISVLTNLLGDFGDAPVFNLNLAWRLAFLLLGSGLDTMLGDRDLDLFSCGVAAKGGREDEFLDKG